MKNAINWFEIPVTDIDKAASLYGRILGRPLRLEDAGGHPSAVFSYDGKEAVSGSLIADPARPRGGGTVIYLDAPDGVDACLARATAGGAKAVLPVTSIGPNGWIALFADLDGNVVGLHSEQR